MSSKLTQKQEYQQVYRRRLVNQNTNLINQEKIFYQS